MRKAFWVIIFAAPKWRWRQRQTVVSNAEVICGHFEKVLAVCLIAFGLAPPLSAQTCRPPVNQRANILLDSGWRLQTQASSLNTSLSTNWVDVPDSNLTNEMSFQINPAGGSAFYRMIYPLATKANDCQPKQDK